MIETFLTPNDIIEIGKYEESNKKKVIFTLYWLDGKQETVRGSTISEAFSSAGLGAGAAKALDFYAEGDNQEYIYDLSMHCWAKKI